MLDNLNKYSIILASNSPRRKELLAGLDIDFSIRIIPDIDESYPHSLKGKEIPLYISEKKAAAYIETMQDSDLIITADTIVYADSKALGKPVTDEEACEMLRLLSGRQHEVITGVCVLSKSKKISFSSTSTVFFSVLTEDEINYYVKKYKPLDKAGAYGIQEWIGYVGVNALNGSYFNVMGLPIQRLYEILKNEF